MGKWLWVGKSTIAGHMTRGQKISLIGKASGKLTKFAKRGRGETMQQNIRGLTGGKGKGCGGFEGGN